MLVLYVQAPFAAFRTFSAGWYRPTAPFLTPSAAYGLALNVAGIESRRDDGLSEMTLTQFGLPFVRIAVGAVAEPRVSAHAQDALSNSSETSKLPLPTVHTLFQQLHNYPVGGTGKERKESTKGNKYNITPVKREFLANLRACVVLDGNPDLEQRVREGLTNPAPGRYGIPFLGDNAFLIDRLEVREVPPASHWYCNLGEANSPTTLPHSTRLTVWIDRQRMSRTQSSLFAPQTKATEEIPSEAWTEIRPPEAPPSSVEKGERKKKGTT